jgi:glycosyltransferase involved in cell wall biosynthesis
LTEGVKQMEAPVLSVVVPVYNEEQSIDLFYLRTTKVLEGLQLPWEMVFVNDGSRDNTLARLVALRQRDRRVQIIDLSRNFGKESALSAGLDFARGDAAIPIDVDLQDPPELIPVLVDRWCEGYEVVNAVRRSRTGDTWMKRKTAEAFYRLVGRIARVDIKENAGDFRLISRPALDVLRQLPERRRFMKGLFSWIGFRSTDVPYDRQPRVCGKSTWSYWKLWNFAIEGITSFSQVPLQLATYFGLLLAVGSLGYGAFIVVRTLLLGNPVPGYPSLMVVVLTLGGFQLMALGVMGEYIARIHDETKGRPLYIVREVLGEVEPQVTSSAQALQRSPISVVVDVRRRSDS